MLELHLFHTAFNCTKVELDSSLGAWLFNNISQEFETDNLTFQIYLFAFGLG